MKGEEVDESLKPSYLDYIKDEAEYLKSESFQEDRQYWMDQMYPLPEEINLSSVKNDIIEIKAIGKTFGFSSELREKIHLYSKENHTSIYLVKISYKLKEME